MQHHGGILLENKDLPPAIVLSMWLNDAILTLNIITVISMIKLLKILVEASLGFQKCEGSVTALY